MIQDTIALLHEWARYLETGARSAPGAPSLTANIYDFALDGRSRRTSSRPLTARGTQTRAAVGSSVAFTNPRAELVEDIVTELRRDCPDLGLVIVAEYRSMVPALIEQRMGWRRVGFDPKGGQTRHQERLANALGISPRTYRERLNTAHHRIDATVTERKRRTA